MANGSSLRTSLDYAIAASILEQQLAVIKAVPAWELKAENRINAGLQDLFGDVFAGIVRRLSGGTVLATVAGRRRLAKDIGDQLQAMADLMEPENLASATMGRKLTMKALSVKFTEFDPAVADLLAKQTFVASEATISRMMGDVMDNLAKSYEAGLGIKDAAVELDNVFTNMQEFELRRVARTEINGNQNKGAHQTMVELGVKRKKWVAASDDRVRDSHAEIDGQIVPIASDFSNGLSRPGDRSGDESEWINCRCRLVPVV